MNLVIENILDLIDEYGEEDVTTILSGFSCPKNPDIENFLKNDSVLFAKKKQSVTYLISDADDGSILGYFTLAIKVLQVKQDAVSSKTLRKRFERFSKLDNNGMYVVPAFLLAQLGKNYAVDKGKRININNLMQQVYLITDEIQHLIGGSLIYLDVEKDNDKLIKKYDDNCGYRPFGKRYSSSDGKSYLMMLKVL